MATPEAAIRAELDANPGTYVGKTDAEVAALLNEENIPTLGPIDKAGLMILAASTGLRDRLEIGRTSSSQAKEWVRGACATVLDVATNESFPMDFSNATVAGMVALLVVEGVIKTDATDPLGNVVDEQAAIMALATTNKSWAQVQGVGRVTTGAVQRVRAI